MSPVFNDNFDMLMHIKRQATPTGSNSNTATAAPSSQAETSPAPSSTSAAQSTTSTQPTTSATPTTTSTSTTPSSTVASATSTSATSSSVVTTSSTSISSTTPVSSTATSTSAPVTSTATSATSAAATSTGSRTTLIVSGSSSFSLGLTTSNGVVYTNTVIVGGTSSATAGASTKKSFFQNTGAVVGVFVVVGVIATALAVLIVTVFIRRRRANQFDKEVQEAAREAARAQAPIDDDDDYAGGTSYNTHSSQPMNTERPGGYGYGGAASSWDPYGRSAAAGAGGGFEMQHRRTSTGTAPGMAGFAAGDVFARNVGLDQSQGYNSNQGYGQGYGQQGYAQDSYNTGYGQGYGSNQSAYQTSYNTSSPPQSHAHTSPPQNYALAQPQGQQQAGRAPIQAQMMMPEAQRQSYNTVAAFRSSPSYGQAHPGEQVEYGNVAEVNNAARGYNSNNNTQQGGYASGQTAQADYAPRQSEDPYGGYEPYDVYAEPGPSQAPSGNPPAYAVGAVRTAGATGDRKGGAGLARRQSGATRYSAEEESDEDVPPRRVLKVANE